MGARSLLWALATAAAVEGLRIEAATIDTRPIYKDAAQPIPARVADLLSRMTVEELIAQVAHRYAGLPLPQIRAQYGSTGLGQLSMQSSVAVGAPDAITAAQRRNDLQSFFLNSSRLGIPLSFAQEGLHSGALYGSVFPMPASSACSWNTSLLTAIGQAMAGEARAYGVDNHWSPVVNLWADSRFGRYQEGFSPDPMLTAAMGVAVMTGLQGGAAGAGGSDEYLPDFNTSVIATAKHFAAYGAAVGGLNGAPFAGSNRTLFEIYLKPWRALAAAGLRSAMPSHNTVLDVPMHANAWLLQTVLRGEFGAGNLSTVSDCNDIGAMCAFGVCGWPSADGLPNATQAVSVGYGLRAGVDLDLQCNTDPAAASYYLYIPQAIAAGYASLEDLKASAGRVLTMKFAAGLFDSPFVNASAAAEKMRTPAATALAREAAAQSIVLLQNRNGTLPLQPARLANGGAGLKLAVIGPSVVCALNSTFDSSAWFGRYGTSYGPLAPQTPAYAGCYGRQNTIGSYILDAGWAEVPLLPDALAAALPQASITVAAGVAMNSAAPRLDLIPAAVAASSAADATIVVLGDDLQTCGEWADRDSLDLPGGQLALLSALINATSAAGSPLIVVLMNGRDMTFGPGNALLEGVDALLEAWRPGEAGATAIVDIITGAVNPSGKLVNSWAPSVGQVGGGASPFLARRVGKWVANARGPPDATDGRVYDNYVAGAAPPQPLFRMGFGLSYTTFNYTSLAVDVLLRPSDLPAGGAFSGRGRAGYLQARSTVAVRATVSICNVGAVDGTEVVQVYSQDPRGPATSPLAIVPFWKRLVGFNRLFLSAGTCGAVDVDVLADDLAQYDDGMTLRILNGTYVISAGGSSATDTLQQRVTF